MAAADRGEEKVQAGRGDRREQSRYGVTALRSRSELVGIASLQRILKAGREPLSKTESHVEGRMHLPVIGPRRAA